MEGRDRRIHGALGTWLAFPPWGSEIPALPLCSASANSQWQRGQTRLSRKGELKPGYQ